MAADHYHSDIKIVNRHAKWQWKPEVKTEEGYSADIYPLRYMSALCPHNISRGLYVFFYRETYILREMLCGHSADIVPTLCQHCADIVPTLCWHISPGIYVRTMSALYPSSVFSSSERKDKSKKHTKNRNELVSTFFFSFLPSVSFLGRCLNISSPSVTAADGLQCDDF